MIYNEIITQLTIKQNQREPGVCFPATRWLHLRGWETVMSEMCCLCPSKLGNLISVAITAKNPASGRQDVEMEARLFSAFVATSGYLTLTLIQKVFDI